MYNFVNNNNKGSKYLSIFILKLDKFLKRCLYTQKLSGKYINLYTIFLIYSRTMVTGPTEHGIHADVIFVIEGTAVNGAYLNDLKTNYVIPTLE